MMFVVVVGAAWCKGAFVMDVVPPPPGSAPFALCRGRWTSNGRYVSGMASHVFGCRRWYLALLQGTMQTAEAQPVIPKATAIVLFTFHTPEIDIAHYAEVHVGRTVACSGIRGPRCPFRRIPH